VLNSDAASAGIEAATEATAKGTALAVAVDMKL
jgi:hypothetical protein